MGIRAKFSCMLNKGPYDDNGCERTFWNFWFGRTMVYKRVVRRFILFGLREWPWDFGGSKWPTRNGRGGGEVARLPFSKTRFWGCSRIRRLFFRGLRGYERKRAHQNFPRCWDEELTAEHENKVWDIVISEIRVACMLEYEIGCVSFVISFFS